MLSSLDDGSLSVDQLVLLAEPYDLETELEHQELLELLDRAFGLLSPQVRQVLIERYVHESPNAEIAARMGLSKGAVAMRLSRGKSKLRMLLRRLARV
jgi:RNA polymerase sigma factor (sigma-70 family)